MVLRSPFQRFSYVPHDYEGYPVRCLSSSEQKRHVSGLGVAAGVRVVTEKSLSITDEAARMPRPCSMELEVPASSRLCMLCTRELYSDYHPVLSMQADQSNRTLS